MHNHKYRGDAENEQASHQKEPPKTVQVVKEEGGVVPAEPETVQVQLSDEEAKDEVRIRPYANEHNDPDESQH